MDKLGEIELTDEVAEALVRELAGFGHDERAQVEHVCNRFRVKKQQAEPVVTAFRRGQSAGRAGRIDPGAAAHYATIYRAAADVSPGQAQTEATRVELPEMKPPPARLAEADPALQGVIISDRRQNLRTFGITAAIALCTWWLTDMTGAKAVIIAVVSSLPWLIIVREELNRIESFTIYVLLSVSAIFISLEIGNGMPWTALVAGFLAANYAPTIRAHRNAQHYLETYGVEAFRKNYGGYYDQELKRLD